MDLKKLQGLLFEAKRVPMYHSVFVKNKDKKWSHYADHDNATDARDDHQSITHHYGRGMGTVVRVPIGDARWHTKGPDTIHKYVEKRLAGKSHAEALNETTAHAAYHKETCHACQKQKATGTFDTGGANIPVCSDCTNEYGHSHATTVKLDNLMKHRRKKKGIREEVLLEIKEGDTVKIDFPSNAHHGKIVKVHQVAPSGKFVGVKYKGEHVGYFSQANLKPLKEEMLSEADFREYGWWDHPRFKNFQTGTKSGMAAQKARTALIRLHHQGKALSSNGLTRNARKLAKVIRSHFNQGRGRNVIPDDDTPAHLKIPGHHEHLHDVDEQQLAELSKKTYANYINQAVGSVGNAATSYARREWGDKRGRPHSEKMKHATIHLKRALGIRRATRLLTKEELQLDELSKKTLGSYIKNAARSKAQSQGNLEHRDAEHNILHAALKTAWADGSREARNSLDDAKLKNDRHDNRKLRNRTKGIDRAVNRLTKEEAEIYENVQGPKKQYGPQQKKPVVTAGHKVLPTKPAVQKRLTAQTPEQRQKNRARHWTSTGVSADTVRWMKNNGML